MAMLHISTPDSILIKNSFPLKKKQVMKQFNLVEQLIKIINGTLVFDMDKEVEITSYFQKHCSEIDDGNGIQNTVCRSPYATKNQVTKSSHLQNQTKAMGQRSQVKKRAI